MEGEREEGIGCEQTPTVMSTDTLLQIAGYPVMRCKNAKCMSTNCSPCRTDTSTSLSRGQS